MGHVLGGVLTPPKYGAQRSKRIPNSGDGPCSCVLLNHVAQVFRLLFLGMGRMQAYGKGEWVMYFMGQNGELAADMFGTTLH